MLARAAVQALEPDLVILDEFQRFKDLLDVRTGGEAAELADYFFSQDDARVLLLSATPYKPFTYAEEAAMGADHYADFLKTLDFLTGSEALVDSVREDFDSCVRRHCQGSRQPRARGQRSGQAQRMDCPNGASHGE